VGWDDAPVTILPTRNVNGHHDASLLPVKVQGLGTLEVLTQVAQPIAGRAWEAVSKPTFAISRGHSRPLGATPQHHAVNFALFARHAQSVQLLLFAEGDHEPVAEIPLDASIHRTGDVWHVLVHDLPLSYLYAYRVSGPQAPRAGQRYDPQALVLDPYARAVSGGHPWGDRAAHHGRRGRIVTDDFDWEDDTPPRTPLSQTILYELHVRGYTRHSSSGVSYPGTFLGLCGKIPYLKALGVTAVELMPIMEFDELDALHRNPFTGEHLKNYWGYSPLSFFAPKAAYALEPDNVVAEFKQMVKMFHQAGLEVILDVVYNHTAEGNEHGPTLSFRGLDNSIYYLLDKEGRYYNFSGCGNTLNCQHPVVRDLILDSLVYLVSECHVDGFRFDLAAILSRGTNGKVLEEPPLLQHIAEHPVLAGAKLIAEPWDAGGLFQLGKFPHWGRWLELNGLCRDDLRRFLRSDPGATASLAKRLCGSIDIYGDAARHAHHSVNFITCHDGFTLHDLVSYNQKHNLSNGDHNRDGWSDNLSYNCGHEGPTDNPSINTSRQRQMRNALMLLLISQGVPLLLQGDEFARTQQGNNNAYCQDNEISWVDWTLAQKNAGLVRFVRLMIALRKRFFALNREQFIERVTWHGTKLSAPDWTGQSRTLAFELRGASAQPHLYVLMNAHWEWQRFTLPAPPAHTRWKRLVDTNLPSPDDIVEDQAAVTLQPADHYVAAPRSTVLLISMADSCS
jgi:glycogen operon protein